MNCFACGQPNKHLKSAVVQGKFGEYCEHCIKGMKRMESAGYARYSRDKDRDDYRKDMLQPRDYNGKPNREFIHAYKEESQKIFTKDELKNYE